MTESSAFLSKSGWQDATLTPIAGDASTRSYWRVARQDQTAILMHDPNGQTAEFSRISRFLDQAGLSAPLIFSESPNHLLIEDFGLDRFDLVLERDRTPETQMYLTAADMLAHLHRFEPPAGLDSMSPERLAGMLSPFFDLYLPAIGVSETSESRDTVTALIQSELESFASENSVLVLRDHHAQNMMWLPQRDAVRQIGLLDFQDAMVGHPAYDLVSMLQDARRDVSEVLEHDVLDAFVSRTGAEKEVFSGAYASLGLQRNLRILGVFVRLAKTQGKTGYLQLLPRVWRYVERCLRTPHLRQLQTVLRPYAPNAEHINRIEECLTP